MKIGVTIHLIITIIQFILHYLGLIGIILGLVALLFANFNRGFELIIGGLIFLGLKYLIGFAYVFFKGLFIKEK